MANRYVYSGASGAATGADWANAVVSLAAAAAIAVAGDTVYVSQDHAENNTAHVAHTWAGTAADPIRVICVNRAGSVPPVPADLRETASVTTTGQFSIQNMAGAFYQYGINYYVGVTNGSTVSFSTYVDDMPKKFERCGVSLASTGSSSGITLQSFGVQEFVDCRFNFSSVGQKINVTNGSTKIRGGLTDFTGSVPTNLFVIPAGKSGNLLVEGVDLSDFGSGKTLVSGTNTCFWTTFRGCKLHASVTRAASPTTTGAITDFLQCSSGAINYFNERTTYAGVVSTETTVIRTGTDAEGEVGSSDATVGFSHKMVSNANPEIPFPLEAFEIVAWVDSIGSPKTVTIEVLTDGVTLTNADLWASAEYLGDASFPIWSRSSNRPSTILTTPSNLPTSTMDWTTTGLTSPVKQKIAVTFTPQMKGWVVVSIKLAKPSTTVFVDQNLTVT